MKASTRARLASDRHGAYIGRSPTLPRDPINKHAGAIFGEDDVARPMPALRQPGDNCLGWAGGLKIAHAIGKPDHAVGVRGIEVTLV